MAIQIQKIRESKKISRSELARRSKVALSYLNALEDNDASPTVRTLEKIAAALEVTVAELISEPNTVN
jgi:transcriptional regulator with XRE-family HTH domain